MTYILGEDAKKDNLQFSKKDKITIIPFESNVGTPFSATGDNAFELITKIARAVKDYANLTVAEKYIWDPEKKTICGDGDGTKEIRFTF